MSVCDAALLSRLPTENTIVVTVAMSLTASVRARLYPCPIWEYFNLSGWMMGVMRSLLRNLSAKLGCLIDQRLKTTL